MLPPFSSLTRLGFTTAVAPPGPFFRAPSTANSSSDLRLLAIPSTSTGSGNAGKAAAPVIFFGAAGAARARVCGSVLFLQQVSETKFCRGNRAGRRGDTFKAKQRRLGGRREGANVVDRTRTPRIAARDASLTAPTSLEAMAQGFDVFRRAARPGQANAARYRGRLPWGTTKTTVSY